MILVCVLDVGFPSYQPQGLPFIYVTNCWLIFNNIKLPGLLALLYAGTLPDALVGQVGHRKFVIRPEAHAEGLPVIGNKPVFTQA